LDLSVQDESAMGGQSLIYSFVANGTNVLAEYTAFSGNFSTIAIQCLQKLPANNNKFTYTCDQHTFNYLVEDGYSTFVSPSFFFPGTLEFLPFSVHSLPPFELEDCISQNFKGLFCLSSHALWPLQQ
jgi:hypothetical protein